MIVISSAYSLQAAKVIGASMHITVFGATGRTGRLVVQQALAAGHRVTAAARHPGAVRAAHNLQQVIVADITDATSVRKAIAATDAIVSALGSRTGRKPTTLYSAAAGAALEAMLATGVRRIVTISAIPVTPDEHKTVVERRLIHPLLRQFFGGGYDDMRRMEDLLARSDRDWTVFRAPRLIDGAATGTYRTVLDALPPRARSISRADLAAAMIAAVPARELFGHAVAITY